MVTEMTSKFRALPALLSDALLAVAMTLVGWSGLVFRPSFVAHDGQPPRIMLGGPTERHGGLLTGLSPYPWSWVVTAAAFLPLTFRRRFPLTVLLVTTLFSALYDVQHFPPNVVMLAPLVALYTVATIRDRRTAIIAGLASAAFQVAAVYYGQGSGLFWSELVRIVSMLGVAGALGDATRNRRAYVREVEQRALDAERSRDEEASRRVDEERLRIARELHDVTAHSLSVIAVQSGAAAHVIDQDPAEARKALEAIRRTSREALDELRAMLGVLRAGEEGGAPLAPVPGLARLGDLVAPLVDAGYDVRMDVDEELGDINSVVESSAYRIVQEALTNVVRHAGICRVDVRLRREDGSLAISIDDNGSSSAVALPSGGHGLTGMRERAQALGGTFEAGPKPDGGFRVAATLPIARSTS